MSRPLSPAAWRKIRALALDVDGVLTDGGVWWGPHGEEWKRFHFADIMGVARARRAGLEIALISGENSPLLARFAEKLLLQFIYPGCQDKAAALSAFARNINVSLAEISFMGDDVNDLPALQLAGLAAAPCTAVPAVLAQVHYIATHGGGQGAVREWVEVWLEHQPRAMKKP